MRLVITGLGMVTAVGYGAVGSCAAVRAGLSRPRALDSLLVGDGEGGSQPVTGHPVSGYAEGFFLAGAWIRLAVGCLDNLRHSAKLPMASDTAFWSRTGLVALMPVIEEARFGWSLNERPQSLIEDFVRPALALQRLPVAKDGVQALATGHCGLGAALQLVQRWLAERRLERVIIVAADSYVDHPSLLWLDGRGRLKQPERPVGLMPGQAGACILVEAAGAARARGAPRLIEVGGVSLTTKPIARSMTSAELGHDLEEAVRQVLRSTEVPRPYWGNLLLDLNGEEWKAAAWGHAQVGLRTQVDFERCRTLVPCESLGEMGAASAVVGAGLAITDLLRASDAGASAIVCSLSELGETGAVLLQRAHER